MRIIILLAFSLACLIACQSKQTETTAADSSKTDSLVTVTQAAPADAFNGTFEYDGGAWENGYLFYRLEMKQKGDSIKGALFMGNYLSKSAAGGYVMPDATMMIDLHGELQGPKQALLMLDAIRDSIANDSTSKYPDVYDVFIEDAAGDLLQTFTVENDQLQFVKGEDTLRWEKK